jgi:hypothetical protein
LSAVPSFCEAAVEMKKRKHGTSHKVVYRVCRQWVDNQLVEWPCLTLVHNQSLQQSLCQTSPLNLWRNNQQPLTLLLRLRLLQWLNNLLRSLHQWLQTQHGPTTKACLLKATLLQMHLATLNTIIQPSKADRSPRTSY